MIKTENLILQADNVIKLFLLYFILSLLSLILELREYFLIQKILEFDADFSIIVATLTVSQTIVNILRGLCSLFIAFYFIRWFYLSYILVKQQKDIYFLNYSASSTIWSWFVPVLNLLYPFLIMRESYETWKNLYTNKEDYSSRPVLLWWLLFISAIIADYFGLGMLEGINSNNLMQYSSNPWPFFVPGIIEMSAILASVIMMKKFKKFHQLVAK